MDQNTYPKRNEDPPMIHINDHDDGYNGLLTIDYCQEFNFELEILKKKILNNLQQ